VRLSAALGCLSQPCTARLLQRPLALHVQEWQGVEVAGSPSCAALVAIFHADTFAARLTTSKAVYHAARFGSPVRWHMAPHSHADLPVLEEWHLSDPRKRPKACGVEGCALQPVTKRHMLARLCDAHIKCLAVLRGGMPQRWCGNCYCFHALGAFYGSQMCAPALHWLRTALPKPDAPVRRQVRALCIARLIGRAVSHSRGMTPQACTCPRGLEH